MNRRQFGQLGKGANLIIATASAMPGVTQRSARVERVDVKPKKSRRIYVRYLDDKSRDCLRCRDSRRILRVNGVKVSVPSIPYVGTAKSQTTKDGDFWLTLQNLASILDRQSVGSDRTGVVMLGKANTFQSSGGEYSVVGTPNVLHDAQMWKALDGVAYVDALAPTIDELRQVPGFGAFSCR
jgi:hypothetical protein